MNPGVVAILAGGQSRRMGQDKAQILWHGEALLTRTARVAREAGCRVVVVGRERPDDWDIPDVEFVTDSVPGQGPLGGLLTALQAAGGGVVLLACDMPLLTASALRWLLTQTPGRHGVAVRHGERWEPLFSRYTEEVLPLAQGRLEAGRRSLQSLIEAGEFFGVTAPPEVAAALVNVNTPDEWASVAGENASAPMKP